MEKIKIGQQGFLYPMPMVIVGAEVAGRVNYMPAAWVTRTNYAPPHIGVALDKRHHTNAGIREHGEFSVSVPGERLLVAADHLGLVSGAKTDKSRIFEVFRGELAHAPMVRECPLAMECRVVHTVDQPTNEFFIGEIVNTYCDESCLSAGKPDIARIRPFTLTMPDNRYWAVGAQIGRAWADGRKYTPA